MLEPYGHLTDAGYLGVIGTRKDGTKLWQFFETEGAYLDYIREMNEGSH